MPVSLLSKKCYATDASLSSSGVTRTSKDRQFHDYFVTFLPSSSLYTDPRGPLTSFHKLPRSASVPHTGATSHPPTTFQSLVNRDTTVVRIPLRSAKHHFGVSVSRGTRPANEDTYQAGVIDIPAFAKRPPASLTIKRPGSTENRPAESASGDPQVFYFGIFDGHGGAECSEFLRDHLHEYVQDAAAEFELQSSLKKTHGDGGGDEEGEQQHGGLPIWQKGNRQRIGDLETALVKNWKNLVGGYFRRFVPAYFSFFGGNDGSAPKPAHKGQDVTIEEVLEYAFLRADFEFISAQAAKPDDGNAHAEGGAKRSSPIVGGPKRFKGGSTCSVAMISTPTPVPYWHPSAPSSLLVSHVGDTRILLCSTETGQAIPVTSDHHPSSPVEAGRLRRYAAMFVTDSFGEERMSGLANTRAFGDIQSKRLGVSAEPDIRRVEMRPAEFSFLVLMSDGVSGCVHDQEVVDIVKEAKTPDHAANDVVSFATDVSSEGDNASCLVIRLGGWERRLEGGVGSMATKEAREYRRQDATDPRRSRT